MRTWNTGDEVNVSLPFGTDGVTVLPGRIEKIQDPGPFEPHRTVRVRFDDPLVMGGLGMAWVSPGVLSTDGEDAPPPERPA